MNVLVTGPYGRVGEGIKEHLADKPEYEFTYLDRDPGPNDETVVADVADYDAIRPAFDGQDTVIHLAAYPTTDGSWEEIRHSNIEGVRNVLEAACDAGVETFIFASSIHAVGLYEEENAPDVYSGDSTYVVDKDAPDRPDSYYGASKAFGEDLGRYYVEKRGAPSRFYAIRIASVRENPYDHPYGDAEKGVDEGRWERGSEEYNHQVRRLKSTWQSHRDLAHEMECCLEDETVEFDVFYGVSNNDTRFFDIEHAREVLGYDPQDNSADWDAPPESDE